MKEIGIVVALCVILSGCMSSGTQVTDQQAAQFQKGVTTESDVIARLGEPDSITKQMDGSAILVYMHVEARPNAVDYVPIVGLFAGGATSTTTAVSFTFDASGRLRGYTSTNSKADVHAGILN